MGWTGYKAATAEDALRAHVSDAEILAGPVWRGHTSGNLHAWIIAQALSGAPLIVCVVADYQNGRWYLKDVDESMGPLEYDVPLEWLGTVPPAGSFGDEWRVQVRDFWWRIKIAQAQDEARMIARREARS